MEFASPGSTIPGCHRFKINTMPETQIRTSNPMTRKARFVPRIDFQLLFMAQALHTMLTLCLKLCSLTGRYYHNQLTLLEIQAFVQLNTTHQNDGWYKFIERMLYALVNLQQLPDEIYNRIHDLTTSLCVTVTL